MGRSTAQWVRSQGFPPVQRERVPVTPPQRERVQVTPPQKDDWQPPSYTEIYPDPDGEKSIMSSVVYCIHHKEGCKWSDELRKLKAHLNTCKHDAVPCTNSCGAMIPNLMMEDHLKFTCPRRRARCEHCNMEFSGQTLEAHVGGCSHEPVYCENKCGSKVQRVKMAHHRAAECARRLVPCRYCNKDFVADTLQAHVSKCNKCPVSCPHGCDASVTRDDMDSHAKECPNVTVSCAFKDAGCRFKGRKSAVEQHMESSSRQHLLLMSGVVGRQQQQIAALKQAVAKSAANTSGTLIWKIGDFAARMAESRGKEGLELISTAFYTSQYGYKLQASLFLNGNGAGEGSHLSIYIKILPGEYDALLRWPFAHTVSFTLYDQAPTPEAACNIVESFIPDPTWKNFQRPSKEPDSLGFGFPRFISHEMLKRRFFVRDDAMFLRVKIEAGKIAAV